MFKRIRIAAILALVLPLAVAQAAEARPGGGFRGGFSSQKSSAVHSVPAPRQPAFGSFGKRPASAPAPARLPQRDSAMARDLERSAAQQQALRNYDARHAAAAGAGLAATHGAAGAGTPPLPPLDPVLPGGRSAGAAPAAPQYGATSAPAPVIVRDSSNHWLWGIGGFMLGRSMSAHSAPPPVVVAAPASDSSVSQGNAVPARVVEHQDSSWLGKFAVLALTAGLAWLAWKAFRLMARAQEVKKHANYTFERN